jgi:2'-5' RNA ligase
MMNRVPHQQKNQDLPSLSRRRLAKLCAVSIRVAYVHFPTVRLAMRHISASNYRNISGFVLCFCVTVDGRFPTTIFIAVPPSNALLELCAEASALVQGRLTPDSRDWTFMDPRDLHISLCRTFSLALHELEPFAACLRKAIQPTRPFELLLHDVRFFSNDDNSRTFGSLMLSPTAGHDALLRLIARVDTALAQFSHAVFYDPPLPHVSFCWSLDDGVLLRSQRMNTTCCDNLSVHGIILRCGKRETEIEFV